MDAEAYPDAADNVLNILWKIGTQSQVSQSSLWTRVHEAALRALMQYEAGVFNSFIVYLGTLFCLMLPIKSGSSEVGLGDWL